MSDVSELFDEIDAELRSDRMKAAWDRYGVYVIGAAVAIVVFVAVSTYYQSFVKSQNEGASARYEAMLLEVQALQDEAAIAAVGNFADGEDNGYGALAGFLQAKKLREAGQVEQAVAVYDRLADNRSLPMAMRDMASLSAASLLVGTIPAPELDRRLEKLLADDNAFRHSARELAGLAYVMEEDYLAAREIYDVALKDSGLPPGLATRILVLRELVDGKLLNSKS